MLALGWVVGWPGSYPQRDWPGLATHLPRLLTRKTPSRWRGHMQAVTVGLLTYRDPRWLSFVLEGLAWARNRTPYRVLVTGCNPEPDVEATGRLDILSCDDASRHYLSRVYRAWNQTVEAAETDLVVLLNDDMYVSDFWLDSLVESYEPGATLPTSLLVESGRIPSAMPEYVRNLGLTPDDFDRDSWRLTADGMRQRGSTEPGRLYMPVLFERATFLQVGGYPEGNPEGTTGDKWLFDRFARMGYRHVTAKGSVVYHVQEGAMRG